MATESVVNVNPDIETLTVQARHLFQKGAWPEALDYFNQIAELQPQDAEIHNFRARTFEQLDRHEDALRCIDLALGINPTNLADLRNRAIVLTKLSRFRDALDSYDAVLAATPNNPDILVRRGLLLNQLDRREEALASIEHALSIQPNALDILNARVIVLDSLCRYTDALSTLDQMLALQPANVDAINNSGMILARLGRFEDALRCYDRSLAIDTHQPQAAYNRSLVRLALGDWIRGFQEFESRWNTPPLNKARLPDLGPLWLGEPHDLRHKSVLVHHEQGYGDSFQCVRYVPLLAARGAQVILLVPPALVGVMRSLVGVARIVSAGAAMPAHDYQCPLMSLPLAFRTTPDTVPATVPYLTADNALVREWAQRLGHKCRPRIGLVWSGRRYAPINYPRDIPFALLQPLFDSDAEFVSLQPDVSDADRAIAQRISNLRLVDQSLTDFSQTAALIENLDFVIAVDTAIVHLAGALAKPVWLMNRYASCWRWLQNGDDSVWYPTLRQFRQPAVGDWESVVASIRAAATVFLAPAMTLAQSRPLYEQARPIHSPATVASPPTRITEKIRFVCATRLSAADFFKSAPLGRSLPLYQTFPKGQIIELRLFANNSDGLASVYNRAIDESLSDPAVLVFCHDDVYLSDYYWADHLQRALRDFHIVGLAGNRRRVPRQASWMFLDDQFTSDNYDNLSGVLGHGEPFPNLRQLSVYGEPGQEVKLLDGVWLATRSQSLIDHDLRFDPQFAFHFYDLDFCRQAELRKLRMGTCAMSLVHSSAGKLGVESWREAYQRYLAKYGEGT